MAYETDLHITMIQLKLIHFLKVYHLILKDIYLTYSFYEYIDLCDVLLTYLICKYIYSILTCYPPAFFSYTMDISHTLFIVYSNVI